MRYLGYEALVEFDEEARVFHGEVLGIRDAITFQADSVEQAERAFADSIVDYLAFCNDRGELPERPPVTGK
jgi:predicted HicB family RNase H-like nuclease